MNVHIVSADSAPRLVSDAVVRPESPPPQSTTEAAASASPFATLVSNAIGEANVLDAKAGAKVDALQSGASDDIHGTMIAAKEAEISVKLLGSIRNHLLDAFQEIWRTSV
jgi:flagellar hook-basal body complex protein FliE